MTIPHQVLSPLSIELGGMKSTPYKSIDLIQWPDIPPFAVLTGVNGSGKTQFLQALAYKLSATSIQDQPHFKSIPLNIVGDSIGAHEIAYLPSAENVFRVAHANISSLSNAKREFLQRLSPQSTKNNMEAMILRARVQQKFGIAVNSQQIEPDLIKKLPDDFIFMLEYNDVSAGLAHVFVGYQVRLAERLLDHQSEEKILEELGRPPWEFVNDALASTDFGYRIVPPENKLLKDYSIKVVDVVRGTILQLNDLSSGEKAILRTMLWFYNTKHNNIFPKLFLLDEPDAHLHPSMTRQFVDILKNVIVDQYGVRVILSTHSPSTVALAPEESIFVMSREQPRIRRPPSKAEAIGLLTSGLVIVSPGTRFVLVEDEADVRFYGAVRDVLTDQGPSKDPSSRIPSFFSRQAAADRFWCGPRRT